MNSLKWLVSIFLFIPVFLSAGNLDSLKSRVEAEDAEAQIQLALKYERGDGVPRDMCEAVRLLRLAADQGVVDAQIHLASLYEKGEGVSQDLNEAARLYGLAADFGDADGHFFLALMYEAGKGVEVNLKEAARRYRLAADQGHTIAQTFLAGMYQEGKGVECNLCEAVRLYRLSAEQGDYHAQFKLASLYEKGEGVERDLIEAARLYRLVAEQGDKDAQYKCGVMFVKGEGVDKNFADAAQFFRLAADRGHVGAQHLLSMMYLFGVGVSRNLDEFFRLSNSFSEQDIGPDVIEIRDEIFSANQAEWREEDCNRRWNRFCNFLFALLLMGLITFQVFNLARLLDDGEDDKTFKSPSSVISFVICLLPFLFILGLFFKPNLSWYDPLLIGFASFGAETFVNNRLGDNFKERFNNLWIKLLLFVGIIVVTSFAAIFLFS